MRALQLVAWQKNPELRDVAVPSAGPGQVLVKIASAGVCHSDLHLMEWPEGTLPAAVPFTLGHEAAGWVADIGAGVAGLGEGDPVIVYGPWGCGMCRTCATGAEQYCQRAGKAGAFGGGLGKDGAMAEYMLVPAARWVRPLGNLDPRTAAPLTDAALTPYHAIKRSLHKLVPGSTAVAIGAGGLGHMGIALLKALSPAQVVAVDLADDKLELAREVGADHAVHPDKASALVDDLTGGLGAQLVLDFVGAQSTVELAAGLASPLSDLAIVGLAGGALPVAAFQVPWECAVTVPYWGTLPELDEVVALAQRGAITLHVEQFPLADGLAVYDRLRGGKLRGRAVLLPNG